jgi:hypothetical protein
VRPCHLLLSLGLMSLLYVGNADASVYRCVIDGVVSFAQDPCAEDSDPIDVSHVGSVVTKPEVTKERLAKSTDTLDKRQPETAAEDGPSSPQQLQTESDRKRAEISDYISKKRLERQIAALETDRKRTLQDKEQRLKYLTENRHFGHNTDDGLTWQQNLMKEMLAVTNEADTRLRLIDKQVTQLKGALQ